MSRKANEFKVEVEFKKMTDEEEKQAIHVVALVYIEAMIKDGVLPPGTKIKS